MKIAIKKENGNIYIQELIGSKQEKQFIDMGYNVVDIGDFVEDIYVTDLNEDLTFSIDKYNERKQKENAQMQIAELKKNLFDTDYQVLKWKEGELTDEQFEPMRLQRKAWREEIRSLGG